MDANGQRFWVLANLADWRWDGAAKLAYDENDRALRLASARDQPITPCDAPTALARLAMPRSALDAFGTWASWDAAQHRITAAGALPDAVALDDAPLPSAPTDLAMGHDGVLYAAHGDALTLLDRRGRWDPVTIPAPTKGAFWRLAPAPSGGVYALSAPPAADARAGVATISRIEGTPFPRRPHPPYDANVFRPDPENPRPPRVVETRALTFAGEVPVAIATSAAGRVAVLLWSGPPDQAWTAATECRLRGFDATGAATGPIDLEGLVRATGLALLDEDRIATQVATMPAEAIVYPNASRAKVAALGDYYPFVRSVAAPFLNGPSTGAHYFSSAKGATSVRSAVPISLPRMAPSAEARNAKPLDSGDARTVWHRLYLEAIIPDHTGVRVLLAATSTPSPPTAAEEWYAHDFGASLAAVDEGAPHGVWSPLPSEIPFHQGFVPCGRAPHRGGLFVCLIQRSTRLERSLRGRFLWVRIELRGDGRTSPSVFALRAYGPRFSYVDRYLPELYREDVFPPDADALSARSTRASFLERFIDNFEGLLTPLEDRIANAHLLFDPRTVPEASLEWLASWIGLTFDPVVPTERRRAMLLAARELARGHGTLLGLNRALDLATGGAVTRGKIVVIEAFRLRRTFATILGVQLDDASDPLLGGIARSGNSFVGDTLFLGDEDARRQLLALYSADVIGDPAEEQALASFFDSLAHRVTVLVHDELGDEDLGLIRRIVDLEVPAEVLAEVATATTRFLVGVASLVGVDTYLTAAPPVSPVRVGSSAVGLRDRLLRPASLDPRVQGGESA